jgi:threonine dehydrogenase-like Zn-dependent dehydrogenase
LKALVLRSPEHLEVLDVPVPELAAHEVLIRVHECGLCGSDVRYFHGENPWAKQTLKREIPNPPNIIFGHELVGTVERVADAANEHLLGKRVGVQTWTACGRCNQCVAGRENFCTHTRHLGHGQGWGRRDYYPGGMAEFCPADAVNCYELPDAVTDQQATFLDPLTAALHAVDVARPAVLDRVLILGAGPIGLMIAQLVRCFGVSETFITDLADRNLSVAQELGVDHAYNAGNGGASAIDGVRSALGGRGVSRVFNTVGSNQSVVESLELLENTGVCVLLASKESEIRVPGMALSGERALKTSTNAMRGDFPRAIALLQKGMVRVDPLVTHRFGLPDGVRAFETACDKAATGAIKIIIDCRL